MATMGIEVEIYRDSAPFEKIGVIEARQRPTVLREILGHGAGSFQVAKSNPKILADSTLLEYRNFVRIRVNGQVVGGFIITTKRHVIVGEGEAAEEVWSVSGEGLRSWAKDANVHPAKGITKNSRETRFFNFSTEQGAWYNAAQWTNAVTNWSIHNRTQQGFVNPWGTAPADWPDAPAALWIWDRWNPTGVPEGYVYFRREFTVAAGQEGDYALFFAVDDAAELYIDGELVHTTSDVAWQETTRQDFTLEAGNHVIALRAYNRASLGSLVAAFYKIGNATSPTAAQLLFVSDSAWKVCGYPSVAPGWTPGNILLALLDEADTRGIRFANNWTPTFSHTHDSAGVPWGDPLSISFDIGATYEDVFEALEESACDIHLDPDTLQLSVWKTRGVDRSIESTAGGVWQESRRNMVQSPTPTGVSSGWAMAHGNYATAPGWFTANIASATTAYVFTDGAEEIINPGDIVTMSVTYRVDSLGGAPVAATHMRATPHIRTGNTYITGAHTQVIPITLGQEERVVVEWVADRVVPAGDLDLAVTSAISTGSFAAVQAGFTWAATKLVIERGSTDGSFYDGSSTDTSTTQYDWLGPTNASISTQKVLVGLDPIILRVGHNLTTADEKGQADIVNTLLLKTADGWEIVQPTDTTSVTKYGILEGQVATDMTSVQAAGLVGEVFEKKALPEKTATFELIPVPGMVPWENFFEGDYVSAPGEVPGVLEKRRIMSISATENEVGEPVFAIEFDAIFGDRVDDLAKMLSKSTHSSALGGGFTGTTGTPSTVTQGSNPSLPAASLPNAPTGVVVNTVGRWADNGSAVADFGLTWNPVISNENNLPVTDITSYEVWGRRASDTNYARLATVFDSFAYLSGYRPGEDWYFQIRAISRTGGDGFFSAEQHLIAAAPIVPLGAPSTPALVTELGVVSIKWDGLIAGQAAPSRFKHMEVQRATSLAGTYTAVTSIIASSGVDSTGVVGTRYWYRLVPVDYLGVKGTPSLTADIVVAGVDLGSLDEDVADAIEAAQAAAAAAAATAGSAAAAAAAAQTDADNAETTANSAASAAAAAVSDASTALTTANQALTSADGMITWSSAAPVVGDGAGKPTDAIWYRTGANGVIGQWRWNGTVWTSSPIDNDAIVSINAAKLTAGIIDAARIGANTITAEKILIGNFDNQIPDPNFTNVAVSGWNAAAFTQMPNGGRATGVNALRIASTGIQKGAYNVTNIPVREGDIYRLAVWVRSSVAIPAGSNLLAPYFQIDRLGSSQTTLGINNSVAIVANTWTKLEANMTIPALGWRVRAGFFLQALVPNGALVDFSEPEMVRVSDATLIADGSISTGKLTTGAVTADKILASTITGDKIAAGTISTSKMLVSNLDNQIENPGFEYGLAGWTLGTGSVVAAANPRTGLNTLTITTITSARVAATAVAAFAVEEGEQYRLSGWVRLLSGAVANTGIALRVAYGPTEASTPSTSADIAITEDTTTTTYVRQTGVWTAPAGAKFARLVVVTRDITAGKTYYVDDLSVYAMAAGELIVDGAITAVKIGADQINAGHLQAGSIATPALQAGAITTEKLAADSVTANELAAGSITADHLTAGAIQTEHLSPSVGDTLDISANSSVNIIVGRQDDLEAGLDDTNNAVEQISTHYSFGPDGAIIGRSDSAFKLLLKNDRVEIVENGIVVSYWDSGRMVVPSFVGDEVVLGNHKLEKYGTGTVVRAI